MISVYLAGPISGLTWTGATEWRDFVKAELGRIGIECFSPLRFKDFLEDELIIEGSYEVHPLATSRGIYTRDRWDVSRADIVLVYLAGAGRVSIGTVMEIAWADMLSKPIVLVTDKDNIHSHPMVDEAVGYTVETIEEGMKIVAAMAGVEYV